MSKKDLKAQLDDLGVVYKDKDTVPVLEALLAEQEHEVTEEDLVENPELVDEGTEVGDIIYLPVEEDDEETEEEGKEGDEGEDEETEEEEEKKPSKVKYTYRKGRKVLQVLNVADVKDGNGNPVVQIQCVGVTYKVSPEVAEKNLKEVL